ncbi:putative membrane protein YccC [Oceanisphaera litoralis]|uniref:FUSC family protein n=1 Tax=Oceanisphaera litoralis TaxID=225144 RepID=UPI001EF788CC|nr:FUSC family protein [Oceanisphaera litoralis]MBM7457253.1 putative membrane protein YccC [Oceanisphaera litoralis]
MTNSNRVMSFGQKIAQDIRLMLVFNKSNRPWHFPLIASLCVGLPVLLGAYFGRFDYGILACMGGLVILYLPQAPVARRMVTMVVCSFGFTVCFTLGVLASFNPWFSALMLGVTTLLITLICRYWALPPPGRFFFIMIASVASTLPFDLSQVPTQVGLMALGGMLACMLAFGYSLLVPAEAQPAPAISAIERHILVIMLESAIFGVFVGGSFLLAHLLGLDNPYWVPISCAAIMQGNSFKMVWHRQIHRIAGTAIGMGLAWVIFALSLEPLQLAVVIILLNFIIESLVVRNYGMAVIFITPLTVLLAEVAAHTLSPEQLVLTRMFDIILGSVIGLVGGWVLHHPRLLDYARRRAQRTTATKNGIDRPR